MRRAIVSSASVLLLSGLPGAPAFAQKPDFTGVWQLDTQKSDDMGENVRAAVGGTGQINKPDVRRVSERLIELARAGDVLEIEQSERDFTVSDREANVRIYYIDGKKHPRQTPWGAKLEAVARWESDSLLISTEGKDLGKIYESWGMEGQQLVFTVRVENKKFASDIVVKRYYDRIQEPR